MAAVDCFGLTRVWPLHEAFGPKPGPRGVIPARKAGMGKHSHARRAVRALTCLARFP